MAEKKLPVKAKKKFSALVIILIVLGVLIVVLTIVLLVKKAKDKKALTDTTNEFSKVAQEKKTYIKTATPPSSPGNSAGPGTVADNTKWKGNDNYPLEIGSQGNRVKYIQSMLNSFKGAKLKVDGNFSKELYENLVFLVGTQFYPLPASKIPEFSAAVKK